MDGWIDLGNEGVRKMGRRGGRQGLGGTERVRVGGNKGGRSYEGRVLGKEV